jgi:hypothetical protein
VRIAPLLLLPLTLTACGGATRYAASPRVTLALQQGQDGRTVRQGSVTVKGTVSPAGASVQVDGQDATVEGSSFTADVSLDAGANVIDVTASAPGHRSDADALRVTYDTSVEIPDLTGMPFTDAKDELANLGLDVKEDRQGSFLDRIFSGDGQVCATDPPPHAHVQKGTSVTVTVAGNC